MGLAEGLSHEQISREQDVSLLAIGRWRKRWSAQGLERLKEPPGRGRRPTIASSRWLFPFWPDEYAFVSNLVESRCRGFSLRAFRTAAGIVVCPRSVSVDVNVLIPDRMMKDYGYDVSDYRTVGPMFGSNADFDQIIEAAHQRGLKVMVDMVLAHTSDQHPWFQESRQNRTNPKADWYVWADPKPDGTPPNNWMAVFGGPSWKWESRRRQYYLHHFLEAQPNLNWHNPQVIDAMLGEVEFWLEHGVDPMGHPRLRQSRQQARRQPLGGAASVGGRPESLGQAADGLPAITAR